MSHLLDEVHWVENFMAWELKVNPLKFQTILECFTTATHTQTLSMNQNS